ncbi:MAG: glycosyltransferase [Bacteroidia bacterium]|nr:glycosyltransferase [Bacteroidia bacterium]
MSSPRLSIITVTYQAARVLPLTLRSTAEQTWRDWEHIFIDGGSYDGTLELIQAYEVQAPAVFWLSERDKGIYDAMNKGLRVARGEYVVFLNAGDAFWDAGTLERLFTAAPPEADVLYGDHRYVNEKGEIIPRRRPRPYPMGKAETRHFRTGMGIAHQALFVRRSLAPFYDLRYPLAADLDWAIRIFLQKPRAYDSGRILIRYLEGGISARRRRRYLQERTQILYQHFGFRAVLESGLAMIANMWHRGYPGVE